MPLSAPSNTLSASSAYFFPSHASHVYLSIYIYICINVFTNKYMYTYMYTYVYMYIYVYNIRRTHTHMCLHIDLNKYMLPLRSGVKSSVECSSMVDSLAGMLCWHATRKCCLVLGARRVQCKAHDKKMHLSRTRQIDAPLAVYLLQLPAATDIYVAAARSSGGKRRFAVAGYQVHGLRFSYLPRLDLAVDAG